MLLPGNLSVLQSTERGSRPGLDRVSLPETSEAAACRETLEAGTPHLIHFPLPPPSQSIIPVIVVAIVVYGRWSLAKSPRHSTLRFDSSAVFAPSGVFPTPPSQPGALIFPTPPPKALPPCFAHQLCSRGVILRGGILSILRLRGGSSTRDRTRREIQYVSAHTPLRLAAFPGAHVCLRRPPRTRGRHLKGRRVPCVFAGRSLTCSASQSAWRKRTLQPRACSIIRHPAHASCIHPAFPRISRLRWPKRRKGG